jgi:hypothetical protein
MMSNGRQFMPGLAELADHDLKIEAAADKLCRIFQQMCDVKEQEVVAQRAAEPTIRAALEAEFNQQCIEAAGLLVKAVSITDSLGIDRGFLIYLLQLCEESRLKFVTPHGRPPVELAEAIERLQEMPRNPEVTYKQKENELLLFVVQTGNPSGKQHFINTTISRAIMDHGGRNPIINMAAGNQVHLPRKENPPCKGKF